MGLTTLGLEFIEKRTLISLLVPGLFAQFAGHSNYSAVFTPVVALSLSSHKINMMRPIVWGHSEDVPTTRVVPYSLRPQIYVAF